MVLNGTYVISRNRHKRPTLMHKVDAQNKVMTLCGVSMREWSRHYMAQSIDELLCMRCKPIGDDNAVS